MAPSQSRAEPLPKRRKVQALLFKPGNLLVVRVWNFTTYSYGEFKLSPTLNMIIGPNGTGKSTFVAAVCLGLGGKVDLIKRKTIDSMIKSGERESTIEITLKNKDNLLDIVIRRTLVLKLTRLAWTINGSLADLAAVRLLVLSFNIQLDNLCHFLPQERVAEFASLSPEKLLLETERTIGDNTLLEKHNLLIELDDAWVEITKKVDSMEESIAGLKADVEKFEHEAQKFQEYEEKSKTINHHRKLLPYAKLQDVKQQMKHLKEIRDSAKVALREFAAGTAPLERLIKHSTKEIQEFDARLTKTRESLVRTRTEWDEASRMAALVEEDFSTIQNEIERLQSQTENRKRELQKTTEEKEDLLRRLRNLEPVNESELTALAQERQRKHEEKTREDDVYDAVKFELNALKRDLDVSETRFRDERRKLENNDRLEILNSTGTRYRQELLTNAYRAHVFLRKEKKNLGLRYYEAPIVSCRVTHQKYAKYFEKLVDNNTIFALFFDNEADYQKVSAALPKDINVPMRVVSGRTDMPPMDLNQIRQMGFDGHLSDFLTGPEVVLQGLKQRSMIHQIPVALKPVDPAHMKNLLNPSNGGRLPYMKFVVENSMFQVGRSKYGSRQTFYHTEHIGEAQLMGAEGLTEDVKREIQKRLHDLKGLIEELKERRTTLDSKGQKVQGNLLGIQEELRTLDESVKAIRKKREARVKLEDTIKHAEQRIEQLERSATQDLSAEIKRSEEKLLQRYVDYANLMANVAELNDKLVSGTIEQKKIELLRQQLENKLITVESLIRELDDKKAELQQKYQEAKEKYDEYKKGDAAKEIRQQQLPPEEREIIRQLAEEYLAQNRLSELFILQKIEQLEDDLSVLSSVDRGSLELLKSKTAELDQAERQLPVMTRKKSDLKDRMEKISIPWEAELTDMVDKISRTFQKKFVTVASDGQVELVKLERYKEWKLEILVKFRENSELKVLDHQSQSGGERAVSTIFFIMSLQGLTNAPIRIVDEINQGMDPKNEKMAHKYLVHTACKKDLSQYFLITPKLLTGLFYHPQMAIHCIFTGPSLKSNDGGKNDSDFLDFQRSTIVQA